MHSTNQIYSKLRIAIKNDLALQNYQTSTPKQNTTSN